MDVIGEMYRFIGTQPVEQALIHVDERGLLFGRGNTGKAFRLAVLKPQSGQKLEAAAMGVVQIEFLRNTGSDLNC